MTSIYQNPDQGGRRCSDREAKLTNELAFEKKVSAGLAATITRLEHDLAKASRPTTQVEMTELRNLK